MSFKKRLLICLIVVAVVPMLVTSEWLLVSSIDTTTKQYKESSRQLLETKRVSLDMTFENARTNLLDILSAPELSSLLAGIKNDQTIQNVEDKYNQMRSKIHSQQVLGNDLFRNIGIYSPDIRQTLVCSYLPDDTVGQFYEEVAKGKGKLIWKVVPNNKKNPDIYLMGAALQAGSGKVMGMAFAQIRYERLFELVRATQNRYPEQNFLLIDDKVVAQTYESEQTQLLLQESGLLKNGEEITTENFTYNHERYFGNMVTTTVRGWGYISIMPEAYLTDTVFENMNPIFIMTLVTLGAAIILALILRRSAYRPVSELAKTLDRIDRHSLNVHVVGQQDDELNQLASSFNQMMGRIQSLISEVEKEKEEKFSAELVALKSQINPHFLYNTLNIIKCLTASGNREDAEQVCVCLIRLLRTSIGNTRECITLQEELTYVKNYTEILHFRVDKQFELIDEVSPELYPILIPKLTLQPIVENCVIHGFEEETKYNSIVISAKEREDTIEITIVDNGRGIVEQKIQELKQAMENGEGLKFSRVGLLNVHERIGHIYGNQYGLDLQSFEDNGTRVVIRIPKRYETTNLEENG